jgi:hypothetical protein
MNEAPAARISLIPSASIPASVTASAPAPDPDSVSARAAIKRCMAAWKRAFNNHMEASAGERFAKVYAAHEGDRAYRNAMPVLSGHRNIRDFIACAAHGILIDAIPEKARGSLLYAAQVAFATLPREEKKGRTDTSK